MEMNRVRGACWTQQIVRVADAWRCRTSNKGCCVRSCSSNERVDRTQVASHATTFRDVWAVLRASSTALPHTAAEAWWLFSKHKLWKSEHVTTNAVAGDCQNHLLAVPSPAVLNDIAWLHKLALASAVCNEGTYAFNGSLLTQLRAVCGASAFNDTFVCVLAAQTFSALVKANSNEDALTATVPTVSRALCRICDSRVDPNLLHTLLTTLKAVLWVLGYDRVQDNTPLHLFSIAAVEEPLARVLTTARAAESTLSTHHWHALHHIYLMLQHHAGLRALKSHSDHWPLTLTDRCHRTFLEAHSRPTASFLQLKCQRAVRNALHNCGVPRGGVCYEYVDPSTGVRVDVAAPSIRMAIEVDGPHHARPLELPVSAPGVSFPQPKARGPLTQATSYWQRMRDRNASELTFEHSAKLAVLSGSGWTPLTVPWSALPLAGGTFAAQHAHIERMVRAAMCSSEEAGGGSRS